MARALPFFKMEMFAIVMPTFSASSVTLIFRLASMTSMLMMIGMALDGQVVFGLQVHGILQEPLEHGGRGGDYGKHKNHPKSHRNTARDVVLAAANEVIQETGVPFEYLVGTMIEIPRAALIADQLSQQAQFFSFGTNDLTQMTFGYSRDDAGTFLPDYVEKKILPKDPFESIDQEGVGQLVRLGTERGRSTNANLKVGVCGEHGGDPDSIRFFRSCGLDYVSCSPYRVPVARLAAAQAELEQKAYEG